MYPDHVATQLTNRLIVRNPLPRSSGTPEFRVLPWLLSSVAVGHLIWGLELPALPSYKGRIFFFFFAAPCASDETVAGRIGPAIAFASPSKDAAHSDIEGPGLPHPHPYEPARHHRFAPRQASALHIGWARPRSSEPTSPPASCGPVTPGPTTAAHAPAHREARPCPPDRPRARENEGQQQRRQFEALQQQRRPRVPAEPPQRDRARRDIASRGVTRRGA